MREPVMKTRISSVPGEGWAVFWGFYEVRLKTWDEALRFAVTTVPLMASWRREALRFQ